MADSIEVVLVTAAAAIALAVLIWPAIPRRRASEIPKPGCAACDQHEKPTGR
jgi:hypothetical protein